MKIRLYLFVVLLSLSTTAFGFIQNLSNETNILHLSNFDANIVKHGNKLYFDSDSAVEEYSISNNGSLNFIKSINKIGGTTAKPLIKGDSLYVIYYDNLLHKNYLRIIDVSSEQMVIAEDIYIVSGEAIYEMQILSNNLIIIQDFSITEKVFNLLTHQFVASFQFGAFFSIHNSLLYHMSYVADSTKVTITDISSFENPIDISSIIFQGNSHINEYIFYENLLYLICDKRIVILDISDILNPQLVSIIENLPNFDETYGILTKGLIVNNQLIVKDTSNEIWVYNVSIPNTPELVSFHDEFSGPSSYKGCLINGANGYLYFAKYTDKIYQISASNLNNFNIIETFGESGIIINIAIEQNWAIFSTFDATYVLNLTSNMKEKIESSSCRFTIVKDSILIVNQNSNNLKVYHLGYDNVELKSELETNTNNQYLANYNNYIINFNYNNGTTVIYNLENDYTLNEVANFTEAGQVLYLETTSHVNMDFIPLIIKQNNQQYLSLLSDEPPFQEISQVLIPNKIIRFLENDNVLLQSSTSYDLANFTVPIQLDYYQEGESGYAQIHNNYLLKHVNDSCNDGHAEFYSFLNHNYEELFEYDFNPNIFNAFLSEDHESLYSIHRYNIYKYDCDYVPNDDEVAPQTNNYTLSNYPNPFHSISKRGLGTTISFDLPKSGDVDLTIYNIKGQKVKTLTNEKYPKGKHSLIWNGKNDKNQDVSSGVYFYKLNVDGKDVNVKKCLLMK